MNRISPSSCRRAALFAKTPAIGLRSLAHRLRAKGAKNETFALIGDEFALAAETIDDLCVLLQQAADTIEDMMEAAP